MVDAPDARNVASLLLHALSFGPGVHVRNHVDRPEIEARDSLDLVGQTVRGKERSGRQLHQPSEWGSMALSDGPVGIF